jgi:hypothetical protein
MSEREDAARTEMAAEAKLQRARQRISECMEVNRLTYEGLSVTLIAQRLGFSRHKVRVLQFWLGWRHSSMKWALGGRSDSDQAPVAATDKRSSRWATPYPEDADAA